MRNVVRVEKPEILKQKEKEWKRELLEELKKGDDADKKRLKTLYSRYGDPQIRNSLRRMYKFCCYCESRIRHVTIDHIEHRKPKAKDKFPECTFKWENLHLACPNCNKVKSDNWNNEYPILDAVTDIPISNFLTYRQYERVHLHPRGKTTQEHTELNRQELLEARQEIFWHTMELIELYNNDPDTPDAQIVPQKLDKYSEGQFGSFIAYLKKTYLKRKNDQDN